MNNSGRDHLTPAALRLIDSSISWKMVGAGGILTITAEDARHGEQRNLQLQVTGFESIPGFDTEQPICAILNDFNFHGTNGQLVGPFESGTLCIGGYGATLLPQPMLTMVNLGGPDVGRDLQLEYVGGNEKTVVVHNITRLMREVSQVDFQQPSSVEDFRQKVAEIHQVQMELESKDAWERSFESLIAELQCDIGEVPGWLVEEMRQCHLAGTASISELLFSASEGGKLAEALSLVQEGFREQWCYQMPAARAHPAMGSNSMYLAELYRKLKLTMGRPQLEADLSSETDVDAQELRQLVESGPPDSWIEVELVRLHNLPIGAEVLLETTSGDYHAMRVLEPEKGEVALILQIVPDGAPADGYWPKTLSSDLRIGGRQRTEELISSKIKGLYLDPTAM